MIELLLKLLIAHVMGDFVFQPNKWVDAKEEKNFKSKYFWLHGLVHLVLLTVLLEFNMAYWWVILSIVVSHLLIDAIKLKLQKTNNANADKTEAKKSLNNRLLFTADQLLHLTVIGILVYIKTPWAIELEKTQVLLFILAIVLVTSASSVIMKVIMSKFEITETEDSKSLEDAGKYIGILERLFIFGFILLGQWSSIGLLIAAKSVFRFGDLSKGKRQLTEYVLIGTLLSFGLAIAIGVLYTYFNSKL